jgi:hypothetical protein
VKFLNLIRCAFGLAAASLLVSCGGGGAESRPVDTGTFTISPQTATWYAGVKNTFTISGGTAPFQLTSSEPGLMPLPQVIGGRTLDVVPNQPSVIDAGLPAGSLLVRTVNVTARSAEGIVSTAVIKVAQNFLTGYGMTPLSTTCTGGATICTGGETTLSFDSTFNGVSFAGHQFRIEKVSGPFQFRDPLNSDNLVDAVTVTADHEGKFVVVIRVASGTPATVAILKVTDIPTGAYTFRTFTIATSTSTTALTLIPDTISLTGADATVCGSGTSDVLVFDGVPPYSVICTDTRVSVASPTSDTQPGRFTIHVGQQVAGQCLTSVPCVFLDKNQTRAVLNITTVVGAAAPAPTTITVAPTALTLSCGASGAVTVVGGTGTYSASSATTRITAVVSGNTVTIMRLNGDGVTVVPSPSTVTITDGASVGSVDVTSPPNCP